MKTNRIILAMITLVAALVAPPAAMAQQTTGNITGRIIDAQGAAVPGVTVTAKNTQTGFTPLRRHRRRRHLPPERASGRHLRSDRRAPGFSRVDNKGVVVNVGQSLEIGMTLKVASVQENITVTGETPLIETRSSSVGGSSTSAGSRTCRSTAGSSPTWRRRSRASASATTPTRPRARSSRRRSTAATAATSTTRSTAATTTTTRSAACSRTSRSKRSRSSTS